MVFDLNSKVEESEGEMNNTSSSSELKRSCVDCQTIKTPCWRSGPAGPKTLCNACGIRYRKKSRTVVGMEKSKKKMSKGSFSSSSSSSKIKIKIKNSNKDVWKRKLGEEERAAFLLMALSYGCVSA